MSKCQSLSSKLATHPAYEELEYATYMELYDGDRPLYELRREMGGSDSCRVTITSIADGDFLGLVPGEATGNRTSSEYLISTDDIEKSLRVFEHVGFEHVASVPPNPSENSFRDVHALLGAGWKLSSNTVSNRSVDASNSADDTRLSILKDSAAWDELSEETEPYALVLTEEQNVTLLAEGMDGATACRQWQHYMDAHPRAGDDAE
ncbi:hypothetical protein [Halocatena marina]|uniref:Uncharacterized protein n=1 Tax=Halocatena marina TaxID=2934937 RepID=A0ABD5YNN5_9EURY|nr:hypothetical protein [Halocatena marina]